MGAGLHKQPSNHEDIFLRRDVALTKYQVQQLALLYLALHKLLHKPIVECWIYFLALEHSWGLEFNSTDQGPSFENNRKKNRPSTSFGFKLYSPLPIGFYHVSLSQWFEIILRNSTKDSFDIAGIFMTSDSFPVSFSSMKWFHQAKDIRYLLKISVLFIIPPHFRYAPPPSYGWFMFT